VITYEPVDTLVERAGAADADAWEALYRRAYPGLLAYAARRLGTEHGKDAVGETMARAVAGIGSFRREGGGFDAWLYGILRHVVIDAQRRAVRERRRRVPGAACDATPLDHVLGGEEAVAVRAAFARLSPAEQEVLELRVVAGLTAEEVGALLGKRPGAVRTAQSRALASLRRALEQGS
jgi:RNA polymerase sigma-70 factor (ECF subfamily)